MFGFSKKAKDVSQAEARPMPETTSRLPPGAIYATLSAVELGHALGQASAWSLLCN